MQWFTPTEVGKTKYVQFSSRTITQKGYKASSAKMLPAGAVLLTTRATIGDASIALRDCCTNQGFQSLIAKNDNDNEFLYYLIQTKRKELKIKANGSTFIEISNQEVKNVNVMVPDSKTQTKIAGFLSLIDKRIETQNKIIEDLNKLKKSLIEDNFANTEFSVSLKEVLKERKSYSEKGLEYEHVTLSKDGIIPKGERYDRDFLVTDESKEYKITKLNDICYNPANLKFGVICLNNYKDSIFSPIYITFEVDKKYNPYYVSLYLTSDRFIKKILKYQQGTVYERMSVNPDDFLKGRLPIIKNQESFISLIKTIDNKCTVEKELLKTFEIQKKYLLKNMFI